MLLVEVSVGIFFFISTLLLKHRTWGKPRPSATCREEAEGVGDTTWLRRETDPKGNTGGGTGGGHRDTRRHLSHTIWGEDGSREQFTGTAVVLPMPLAWKGHMFMNGPGRGKDENGCLGGSLSTLVSHQTSSSIPTTHSLLPFGKWT